MRPPFELPLPRDKYDIQRAAELAALGWEEFEAFVPGILEWLQDMNWPVAATLQPLLAAAGARLAPFIRPILAADDAIWTYNILHAIVSQSPSLAAELSPELQRLARSPTAAQDAEGVSLQVRLILAGGPP